jgi:hypothetical protein
MLHKYLKIILLFVFFGFSINSQASVNVVLPAFFNDEVGAYTVTNEGSGQFSYDEVKIGRSDSSDTLTAGIFVFKLPELDGPLMKAHLNFEGYGRGSFNIEVVGLRVSNFNEIDPSDFYANPSINIMDFLTDLEWSSKYPEPDGPIEISTKDRNNDTLIAWIQSNYDSGSFLHIAIRPVGIPDAEDDWHIKPDLSTLTIETVPEYSNFSIVLGLVCIIYFFLKRHKK